ncbi:MAG: C25 family cysteine peptidase, partial [Thermoplasmatota archaeon]
MKKMIPFFIIMLVMLSSMTSLASSERQDHKIRKEHIVFSEPSLKETTYSTIHIISSESYLMDEGKPLLPRYTETFTFPFGTDIKDVRCIVKNVQHIGLSKQLEPSPKKISVGTATTTVDENLCYLLTETYPEDWYDFHVGCGIVGDERVIIAKVDISPARYDPIEHHISWVEEIDIEIDYEENTVQIHTDEEFDLLVISPLSYAGQVQPLVNHKNSRGIPTKLVTLSEISSGEYFPARGRDDIEEIKYFIKDAIENWLITNVLIIGGASDVPARETHVFVGEDDDEVFVSDLYYADIYDGERNFSSWDSNGNDIFAEYNWDEGTDDIDFYPDVKIGRLACIDNVQVTTAVNKIITYETSKAYTQNWFNNIVVIGGDTVPESYGDDSDTDEGERVNQFILDRMQGFIPDRIWDSNGRLSGLLTTGLDAIKMGIEHGCGFLDFSGHGGSWVWTTFPHNGERQTLPTPTGRYTNTIIGELRNGDMLPIVINGGCSLGKYQEDDNCNAWAFIANPYGGGIASFGATGLGYVYVGIYITEGLVEGLNIDIIEAYRDGAITFGEMYSTGLFTYIHGNLG